MECRRAYVEGVSTRKVDSLLEHMGLSRIDKSEVSAAWHVGAPFGALDEPVRAFRERALQGEYPYLWVDATYLKVRQNLRHGMPTVVSMAAVVAIGVRESGEREILGVAVGASE